MVKILEKRKKISIFLIALDIILFVLFALLIPDFLWNIVGDDVIEYENWHRVVNNPVYYHFGVGCWEITIVIFKMIAFIVGQLLIQKENDRKRTMAIVKSHIAIGILGLIFVFTCAHGYSFIYLLQCMVKRIFHIQL